MRLTFGKFEGWEVEDLARAGEVGLGYLSWGTENLRSPKWRRIFQEAITHQGPQDLELTAKAITTSDPYIEWDDAMMIAMDEMATKKENEEYSRHVEARQREILEKWAPALTENDTNKLRAIARRFEFEDTRQIPSSRFSSEAKRQGFLEFMDEWRQAYD